MFAISNEESKAPIKETVIKVSLAICVVLAGIWYFTSMDAIHLERAHQRSLHRTVNTDGVRLVNHDNAVEITLVPGKKLDEYTAIIGRMGLSPHISNMEITQTSVAHVQVRVPVSELPSHF